jgi:glycosidase
MDYFCHILPRKLRVLVSKRAADSCRDGFERPFECRFDYRMKVPGRIAATAVAFVCATFATAASSHGSAGFFKEFVIINRGSGNEYFGNPLGSGFHGQNLTSGRTWYQGDSAPVMNGAEANTWENNGDWVSNVRFHYRINTSAGTGSFSTVTLDQRAQTGGDRKWDQTAQNIALATRSPGTYGIEVYFQAQGNYNGGSWQFYNSASPDYRATFTVTAIPSPSGQTASAASSTQVDLGWTQASTSSARPTVIFRSTSSTAPTLVGGTAYSANTDYSNLGGGIAYRCVYNGSGTSHSDTGLTTGQTYYYYFYAVNNNYYSAAATANATTWAVPAAPTIGTITPSNGQLSVAFTAGADNGSAITGYKWSLDGTNYTLRAGTVNPIVITGLSNGTAYTVRIRAVNAVGDGAAATAGSTATPRTTPGVPTINSISAESQLLSVNFTAPSSDGGAIITDYKYSTDGGSTWRTRAAGTTASPLVITTLSSDGTTALVNGTSYNVQIRAVNTAGDGTATSTTAATPYTTPGVPTIDSISAGDTQLTVYFTAGSTGGSAITNYEYSTDGGTNWTLRSPVSTASPIVITGLTNDTTYSVRIRAVNAAGSGTQSDATSGTPVAAIPTISTSGAMSALSTTYGTASSSTSFAVSGANMTEGILVTAPAGFQVSTNDSTFSSTVTVGSAGTISSTTVYVRLSATTTPGTKSGNVVLTSSGAATINKATVSSTVNQKALTVSGAAVTSKTYDGTDSAVITGSLVGLVGSDTVTLTGTGTFASPDVGTGISVTSTSTLDGAEAANYTLTQPTGLTGTITAKALTISGAAATNRAYNGTTTVAVSGGSLVGVESGDTVALDADSATGNVATAAIGTGKSVTVTGYALGGTDAGNYSVTQPTDVTVDITAKALTISGATATNRDYDGTTTVAVSGGSLVGVETGDTVTLDAVSATGNVATATAGSGKTVTVTGYALDGADVGNYSVTQPADVTVDIAKATPAISTPPTASAIYFGQAISNSTLSGGAATGAGGGALAGTFAWTSGTTVHAAGTTSYSVTFSPTDTTNYNTATAMVTLPTSMPQARNSGTAGAPQKPASLFLGDNGTFGLDSWGAIGSNWGQARLWVRFNNSDLTGGTATTYSAFVNQDNKTRTSPRFSQVGTWYWGFQMNYSSPYGNDYWYKASLADWTAMSSSGTDATLTVEVSALNDPSGATATAGSSTSIDLSWTKGTSGDAKDTIIVRREGSAVATDPTQGTAYSASDTLGTGTVVYRGNGTTFSDTGLTPGATYHYKLYAENWSYYSAGVTASAATPGSPSITVDDSTSATTTAFSTTYGAASAAQTFAIVGSSLTANITATAPSGFEVSSDGTTYGSTATFTQTSGSAGGTLRIRLAATATAGNYNSAVVTLASTGATTRNITTPVSGNTVSKATPSITAAPTASTSIIKGDALSNNLLSGGTASTAGTFTFDNTSAEQTASGSKAVTFTPTDATNFNTVATTVNVTVEPVPDPTNVTATSSGATSIALTHNLTSSKNVMIVRRTGSAVTFTPADNTNYSNGQNVGDGHFVVHGSLAANTSSDTGLDPSTTYHYKIFSENWGWYSAGVATSATTDAPPPTITVTGSPSAMTTNYGTASAAQSFTVSGVNLSASLSVAAPAGFEVSESSGSGYGSAVTLTPSSGTVASTTIYVRLKSNASPGANSGNITLASTGATSQTVAVSGTVNVASMSMTINSPAGSMNADYTTSKLFVDELAGTANNVTITFSPGLTPDEVEVWTNLNNRERADDDANSDGIPDGIIPPDPPTDKPVGYTSGVYPTNGYFQAHPMSGSAGTYTLTINANKTGAYRLTARYRMNGGPWVYYNYGGKRDHAITVTPILARNMNVYEVNVLNINATGGTFQTRSTFEDLTDTNSTRVNLDYLRNMGVNTLWFQPIHPNGVEGREPSSGWDTATSPYDPGSPYAVKNFFEVMEIMTDSYNGSSSVAANRAAAMSAFTNFVAQADTKGVHVMLDAPFNHTAYDVEVSSQGLELLAAAGVSTTGWSATDKIKDREARFFSRNDGANAYAGPASSAANIAPAPDRNDFGKWRDVLDVFFGRYSALVEGNPSSGAALNKFKNESDAMEYGDLTGGANSAGAVTRAVWEYFARYVPYWLEQTGLPAGSSAAEQAYKGVDGLRADFGQGMPPQFWEYVINVAREHKWNFVFMSESLDGGEVTYRSNRHFDILNENIVFPWQQAGNTTAHRTIFEDRRAAYGQGLVLLNNTSHDEAGYADPWQAFIRYAVGSTVDGAPMIMYGQEIGTAASLSFDHYEVNFGKSIPHFKRWNSMNPQWTAWGNNSLGVRNLMPNYSGVGLAREFSAALRSSNRWFLNPINTLTADPDIFAVAKYETANASPSNSDVVLAFVNLNRNSAEANTFGIPAGLGTLLGIEANKYYNVRNIAAYLGPNNEYNGRRDQFLWGTPRLGSDILSNGIYVAMNPVPSTDGAWSTAPYEVQYLKVYAAPNISVSGSPSALSSTYGSASANTSFTLSGSDVHGGVSISAPSGFQVSTNASSGFAGSITLNNTGTIGATTIYVRLAGNSAVGSYSGNVTISSPGGNSTTVAVPSSTVSAKALTVTGATASNRAYDGTTTVAVSGGELVGVVGADDVSLGGTATGATANANVGTNKAVTVSGYTISGGSSGNYTLTQPTDVTVTITTATPTISTAPTATAITEGQALSASTLIGGSATGVGGAAVSGEFAFTSPNTVPAVGTANQSVTFTPSDANYGTVSGLASVTVNPTAVPLPEGIKFSVSTNGVYSVVDSNNLPIEGATFTYLYTGRTNGVTGLNTNYSFMSYSNTNPPSQPGFYNVTATAGGAYTGSVTEDYGIAGPLYRTINLTRTAGTATNSFSRALLMSNVQRVSTNFTVLTGASGLSWTNAVPGQSTMPNGTTNANTVTIVTTNTLRLIPANSNSVNDTFGITISDGATPIAFPVIVTTTNAQSVPTLTAQRVVTTSVIITNYVNDVPTFTTNQAKRVIFMARPGRTINVQFLDPESNTLRPITTTNVGFISPTNQPTTNETITEGVYHKPVNFAPPTGVLELMVDPSVQFYMGRPTNASTQ